MAKKGYPSKDEARRTASEVNQKYGRIFGEYQAYTRTDPVSGEKKHFIRKTGKLIGR